MSKHHHPQHETMLLARYWFRDKQRLHTLLRIWTSRDGILELGIAGFFHVLLHEPVHLMINLESVRFFPSPVFSIPLRLVDHRVLQHLYHLLNSHHRNNETLFTSKVTLSTFTLTYHRFKYDAVLDQHLDRILLVRLFLRQCHDMFHLKTNKQLVVQACLTVLRKEHRSMQKLKHPLRRRLSIFINSLEKTNKTEHRGGK